MSTTVIDRSKEAVARRLAESHIEVNPAIVEIRRLVSPAAEDQESEPVKLLEVNEGTIAAGIIPVGFAPDASTGIFYRSVIVEVTPEEFARIEAGQLQLPHDWQLGQRFRRQRQAS